MDIGTAERMEIGADGLLLYNFSLVKAATNDFSENNKLGQGGFGAVYKVYTAWSFMLQASFYYFFSFLPKNKNVNVTSISIYVIKLYLG